MYRNCIFCSARLGSNEALERFPVGKTLAFDAAKGRLWAVCPTCARWNLAPVEERWEVIEDAERAFRDTRRRVQSENVGLARLRDGTRLIRVGAALAGEMAAWRYGRVLERRRWTYLAAAGGLGAAALAGTLGLSAVGLSGGVFLTNLIINQLFEKFVAPSRRGGEVATLRAPAIHPGVDVVVAARNIRSARLDRAPDGGVGVWIPDMDLDEDDWATVPRYFQYSGIITGADALTVMQRGMVVVNARGAARQALHHAIERLDREGGAAFLERAADRREPLADAEVTRAERRVRSLALEMALHEESERRAMEGELAALEAMWREAEQIAAIADRLPDAT